MIDTVSPTEIVMFIVGLWGLLHSARCIVASLNDVKHLDQTGRNGTLRLFGVESTIFECSRMLIVFLCTCNSVWLMTLPPANAQAPLLPTVTGAILLAITLISSYMSYRAMLFRKRVNAYIDHTEDER